MRTIELDSKSFLASPEEKRFILLRSKQADKDESFLTDYAIPKILQKKDADKIPGVWGTLGYKDDNSIDWDGTLECSNEGNDDFDDDSTVKEEVDYLKYMYPLENKGDIKEKVINLNQLDIPFPEIFTLEEIPRLRLDVFLGKDEGALAFFQFRKNNDKEAELEFILPESTGEEHSLDKRDRLCYFFNALPKKSVEEVPGIPHKYRLSSKINEDDFIVKVLIFKRSIPANNNKSVIPTTSTELIKRIEDQIASYPESLIIKKHKLLVFNPEAPTFIEAQPGSIDKTKKTLLLLHGTFASTKGSFKEVYGWIASLVGDKKYEQVIAFDHPSLFFDAEMNINVLIAKLNDIGIQSFVHEVDLIGTSQGGLLAQHLANMKQPTLKVGKVALVASANGVAYLTAAKGLTTGLKLLRKVLLKLGFAPAALIAALLQHSFKWIINQPGLALMQPGNERLNKVIYQTPLSESTRYYPLAGVYESVNRFRKKKKLERAIDLILDEDNDWVVGTKNQFKAPSEYVAIEGYNPGKYREYMIRNAKHGSLIEKEESQNRLAHFFFNQNIETVDFLHKKSQDNFDAHCHLFGRSIINPRILLMLMGDLIDYFREDDKDILLPPIKLRPKGESENKFSDVIQNIFKYFFLNRTTHHMLHDLEEEYYELQSDTYRYIPLMFDLEMTFRNQYDVNDASSAIKEKMKEFKKDHEKFYNKISEMIKLIETKEKAVFNGTRVQVEESHKVLKYAKTIFKGIKLIGDNLLKDVNDSYLNQIEEHRQLKVIYGADIFPYLATDPRREGMEKYILDLVGRGKTFHGIKIYSPNGYSPTDPKLFDPATSFIDGTCLYQWCIDNNISIMAHNSDAGFATFVNDLEVWGDICTEERDKECSFQLEYKDKKKIEFRYNIREGGFDKGIKERAHRLNHPCIWKKVLSRFPKLKICFAHFGGGNELWQDEIAQLIATYDNVFTDLSCQTNINMLKKIKSKYFETDSPENKKIRSRIMYGSDYFLNLIHGDEFDEYYQNFKKVFKEQLGHMQVTVPKTFLSNNSLKVIK
jgi:pimeloyl-ACP methyl ester carboxylesterase